MNERLAALLPFPQVVRPRPGWFAIGPDVGIVAGPGGAEAAAAFRRVLGWLPWPEGSGRSGGPITVDLARELPAEAYRLWIGPDVVRITAGGAAGAFYAAQTLRQLLPDEAWRAAPVPGPAWNIPCAEIEDAPALAWRGAHLDVARHFFPKRTVLALIDALAAMKVNRLHLHLTDDQGWRIESRRYPALHETGSHRPRSRTSLGGEQPPAYDDIPHGGYYTLADLAEISACAAQRMMTLVPEVEVPGHATALLAAMPQLGSGTPPPGGYQVSADWGIFPNLMSPLPPTRDFLAEIFAELLGAIPGAGGGGRYVHIGGDECVLDSWRDDPRIEAYWRQRGLSGPAGLHACFLRDVADLLADDFGARALVWDEGFASAASGSGTPAAPGIAGPAAAAGQLRPDTIVMAWRGTGIACRAAGAGHDVIAAPVLPTYFDYSQADDESEPAAIGGPIRVQDVAAFEPVPADWPDSARRHLIGTQFQVWTEYIPDARALEYMIFPRACALAEVAWAGRPSPWQDDARGSRPPLRPRLASHLGRLAAAGIEYRPLDGPWPWQRGGTGPRRHRGGYRVQDVAVRLGNLAAGAGD
ncbi:MAG: beta-N-acetylhexosaminidase [Streptosporangiaceae bacterium]